eukprot:6479099-Amphidinium_carterae.2
MGDELGHEVFCRAATVPLWVLLAVKLCHKVVVVLVVHKSPQRGLGSVRSCLLAQLQCDREHPVISSCCLVEDAPLLHVEGAHEVHEAAVHDDVVDLQQCTCGMLPSEVVRAAEEGVNCTHTSPG